MKKLSDAMIEHLRDGGHASRETMIALLDEHAALRAVAESARNVRDLRGSEHVVAALDAWTALCEALAKYFDPGTTEETT